MFEIMVTESTHSFIMEDSFSSFLIEEGNVSCCKKDTEYILSFDLNTDNIDTIYDLIQHIYKNKPHDNNRWICKKSEATLTDSTAIKYFLYRFEGTHCNPLQRDILSNIIRNSDIRCLQQVRELAQKPFSGILPFDGFDMFRLFGKSLSEQPPKCIRSEHKDIYITNRYIPYGFEIAKGTVNFQNCIIDGDILLSSCSDVHFSQCIITGKVTCFDASKFYMSSVNMKQLILYNSQIDRLYFEFCQIYRFAFHTSTVEHFFFDSNKIIEPYLANLALPDKRVKMDMSQFVVKNISKKQVERTNGDIPVRIKNENNFYLSFLYREPVKPVAPKDIALDMVDVFLSQGNLEKNHQLYSELKYKKALYSNTGWRRYFVFFTGAYYKPSRWILYLVMTTVIFTALYTRIPAIQFINATTSSIENMDFWTALYYSLCQIIGSNPTSFNAFGIAQIFTTLQSLLNTAFIANLFASLIKKFLRE